MIILKKISIISILLIILDQVIKLIVDSNLALGESINIISNFFSITYVRNTGAAFSILNGSRLFLIIIAVIALYFIYQILIKNQNLSKLNIMINSLLISGIIGNMFDRIVREYVIDYLDFNLFGYSFPIFNLADICIVIGCFLLIITTIKEDKNGNKSKTR